MTAKKLFFEPTTRTTEYQLKNGLKLLVYNDPAMMGAFITLNFYSGSHEDKKGGEAHFLEHLTIHPDIPEEKEKPYFVDTLGADLHPMRSTSYDDTTYSVSVPVESLQPATQYLFDVTFNLKAPLQDFEKQQAIILREFTEECDEMANDRVVDLSQWKRIFSGTSLEGLYSVLGSPETIKSITEKDLIEFKETHYVINNAIIVVVTSTDSETIFKTINKCTINPSMKEENSKNKKVVPLPTQRDVKIRAMQTKECVQEVSGNSMITLNCLTNYQYEHKWVILMFQHKARQLIRENKQLVYSVNAGSDIISGYDLFTAKILVDGGKENAARSQQLLEGLLEFSEDDKEEFERIQRSELNGLILHKWDSEEIVNYLINLNDPQLKYQKRVEEEYLLDKNITFEMYKEFFRNFFQTHLHFLVLQYES